MKVLNAAAFWLQPAVMNFDVSPNEGATETRKVTLGCFLLFSVLQHIFLIFLNIRSRENEIGEV